jgi:hypothetical protein
MTMNWCKTMTTYQTQWQTTIERSLEAGQTPLIELGASLGELSGLSTLVALLAFAGQRNDLTAPVMVAGGNNVAWLIGLLYQVYLPRVPALTAIYGGAEPVTQMASSALYDSQLSTANARRPTAPPTYLAPFVTPQDASSAPRWEALPFLLGAPPHALPQASGSQPGMQTDPWLTWAGVCLAFVLILLALLV